MELEDLDGPTQAPTRATRFAPKNSKFAPKPQTASVVSSDSIPSGKKEELDIKPPIIDSSSTATTSTTVKSEYEPLPRSLNANGQVKMDVVEDGEAKTEGGDLEIDPMEVEGDEDVVVREIDVYFTPSVDPNTKLYVMQYPLRPLWRPYELDERCEEVRVKPSTSEVEVDLAIDVDSKNYDPDANSRVIMTKQTLSTSWIPPCKTGYVVGVLNGNKLCLNPIHAVVQLRPSMRHLESSGLRKRSNATGNLEDVSVSEKIKEEKSAGLSKKKQSKQVGASNEQNQDVEECWIPLKYHGQRSDISGTYNRQMVAQGASAIQFSMSPYDYINSLCPGSSNDKIQSKGPSRRFLLSLPLEDRYRKWLLEGPPVHRFDALKHLAPNDSTEDVLGVLQKFAQLVQGLWLPKSSLLYGKERGLEALARDYILLLFNKNLIIGSAQVPERGQLGIALKAVLNVLAVQRHSLGDWKFKETPDVSFIKLHPHIVQEQERVWQNAEKPIIDIVLGKNRPGTKNTLKPIVPDRLVTPNSCGLKTSNGTSSRMPMSDETREALPKALMKVFQTQKVCSLQTICKRLQEMAVSESSRPKGFAREAKAAALGVDAPQEELQAIINQVATYIHGVYVLKSSPDHPQYDGLRKIVIDLLIAEGPNAKLKKASITEAAKLQLNRDITPNEYQKVLSELCVSQGSAWVLKKGDGNPK